MTVSAPERPSAPSAAIDRRWRGIRRAVVWTVLLGGAFIVFVATKQIKPLYNHAPWANDPFDAVFSLASVFAPLLTLGLLAELLACRGSRRVPAFRQFSILRACRLTTAIVVITVIACWTSVATEANQPAWTPAATTVLIVLLAAVSLLTGLAVRALARTARPAAIDPDATVETDWAADLVHLTQSLARHAGPLRAPGLALIRAIDMKVVTRVRTRPVLTALLIALAFGAAAATNQGVREGYALSAALLFATLQASSMFAFLILAGGYLGLIRAPRQLTLARRRALDAAVGACIGAHFAVSFRHQLPAALTGNPGHAGNTAHWVLLATAALAGAALTAAIESIARTCR
jgi:hypothetical protein